MSTIPDVAAPTLVDMFTTPALEPYRPDPNASSDNSGWWLVIVAMIVIPCILITIFYFIVRSLAHCLSRCYAQDEESRNDRNQFIELTETESDKFIDQEERKEKEFSKVDLGQRPASMQGWADGVGETKRKE